MPEENEDQGPGLIQDNDDLKKAQNNLEQHLRDRVTANQTDFSNRGTKESGVTAGYVAERSGKKHILKQARKKLRSNFTDDDRNDDRMMRRDMITEYVSGRVYERFLYDRAPKINLATTSEEDPVLYVTSKFFDNFKTLSELTGFTNKTDSGLIDPNHPSLNNIEGFEKVIAACNIGGELDYHAGNLGVVPALDDNGNPRKDANDKPIYNVVKIDHGRSWLIYENEESLREDLLTNTLLNFGYYKIKFNISKYKESLEEMANISDDEIDALNSKAIYELKKQGMVFSDIDLLDISGKSMEQLIDEKIIPDPYEVHISSEKKVSMMFSHDFKKRRDVVKDLVKTLEIIEKIGPVEEEWKDGSWRLDIKDQDPIVWALENSKQVDGQDPIAWAAQNGKKISLIKQDGTQQKLDPIAWALENGKQIDGQDPIIWALENEKEVDGQDPITWAAQNGKKIDEQNPLAWAMNNNITTIDGEEIKTWIDSNRESINLNQENHKFLKRYDLEEMIRNNPSTRHIHHILFNDIDKNLSKEEALDICAIKLARLDRTGSPIPKDTLPEGLAAGLKFIEEERKPEGGYLFSEKSNTYKNIMGQSSDYIALKIREAKRNGNALDLEELNLNAIIKNSPPILAEKILRIAEKVNEQERNPPSKIQIASIKFKNFRKGKTSQNFNDQKLSEVFEGFKEASANAMADVPETKLNLQIKDEANIRNTLEKMQEVMREKTNNKVVGQVHKINAKAQSNAQSR